MPGRQFWIGLSITLLFPMCVHYIANAIHPYPEFHQRARAYVRLAPSSAEEWKAQEERDQAEYQWQQDLIDIATQPFFRILIWIATPLGIAAIFVGSYLGIGSVGTGLMLGGILTVADAYWGYWNHLNMPVRLASALAGLGLLIFLWRRHLVARSDAT
ncbi:MAG TPA: hypothetical protein VHU22_02405 [Xanthobacteraceae bacterium]|jgi:hypothetical protein|nr:hypothetical protein [Xanthobacteraceae bacterium]